MSCKVSIPSWFENGEELVSLKNGKLISSSLRYWKKNQEKGTGPKKSVEHYKIYQHICNGQSLEKKEQEGIFEEKRAKNLPILCEIHKSKHPRS